MDNTSIDRMKHVLNTEVIRRMLIKYFKEKGFIESFDRMVYPAVLQDLTMAIPALATKLEIEPHAVEVDPSTGKAVLGWNLFVLGNHRMYLGETYHQDLTQLAKQIQAGQLVIPEEQAGSTARRQSTARQIVTFITRVLAKNEAGYVDLAPGQQPQTPAPSALGQVGVMNGQFYGRNGGIS